MARKVQPEKTKANILAVAELLSILLTIFFLVKMGGKYHYREVKS